MDKLPIKTKQQAFDLFEDTRGEFLAHCRWVAERIFKEKGHVTIDDVREQVTTPKGVDPRVYGAVFNGKEWEKVGHTLTKRKSSHRRPISIFVKKGTPFIRTYLNYQPGLKQEALF